MRNKQFGSLTPEFTNPKWPPLIIAILSFSSLLWWAGSQITPIFTSKHSLAEIYVHGHSYVSYKTVNFIPQRVPTVIMLGGSAVRESTSLNKEFEKLFQSKYNKKINFLNLASSSQNIFESIAIASTLDLPKNSLVFIQASYKKLIYSEEDLLNTYFNPKIIGLDYSSLDQLLDPIEPALRKLIPELILYRYPINFFTSRKNCLLIDIFNHSSSCYRKKSIRRHLYKEKTGMNTAGKKNYVEKLRLNVYPNFLSNHEFSLSAYKLLSSISNNNSHDMVFIDLPIDPEEKPLSNKAHATDIYRKILQEFNTMGTYLDWRNDQSFSSDDFHDSQHMKESGKIIFSNKLANYIYSYYFEGESK